MVAHAFNLSTQELEKGRELWVQNQHVYIAIPGHLELYSRTLVPIYKEEVMYTQEIHGSEICFPSPKYINNLDAICRLHLELEIINQKTEDEFLR